MLEFISSVDAAVSSKPAAICSVEILTSPTISFTSFIISDKISLVFDVDADCFSMLSNIPLTEFFIKLRFLNIVPVSSFAANNLSSMDILKSPFAICDRYSLNLWIEFTIIEPILLNITIPKIIKINNINAIIDIVCII